MSVLWLEDSATSSSFWSQFVRQRNPWSLIWVPCTRQSLETQTTHSWGKQSAAHSESALMAQRLERQRNSYFAWIPSFWMTMEFFAAVVQSLSRVRLFTTPWTAERRASLSLSLSQSLPKFVSIESVMPSNHLILCCPSSPAFNLSQHQGLFQWVNSSHQVAKELEFQLQHQSFQRTPRTDLL